MGGALTIAFDAVGYLASSLSLLSIRKQEEKKERDLTSLPPNFFGEMKEGVKIVVDNPILTRIASCTATTNFGTNIFGAVFAIFALDYLKLSPFEFGLIGSAGAFGFIVGALITGKVTARLGVGMTLAVSIAFSVVTLAVPLAQYGLPLIVLGAVAFIGGFWIPAYNINQVSLRQAITPNRLQGRMNATMRTIVWGTIPIGSIVGGFLGGEIGVVNTIYVGSVISGLAALWILLGPVAKIRSQPESVMD